MKGSYKQNYIPGNKYNIIILSMLVLVNIGLIRYNLFVDRNITFFVILLILLSLILIYELYRLFCFHRKDYYIHLNENDIVIERVARPVLILSHKHMIDIDLYGKNSALSTKVLSIRYDLPDNDMNHRKYIYDVYDFDFVELFIELRQIIKNKGE